ncbi:sulfotransferase [Xanthomonadaceae bacterium JHOS43]|nr:sulfotransferase [Xanthomonadaceae bacterium JHOS43]
MNAARPTQDMAFSALERGDFRAAAALAQEALARDSAQPPMHFVAGVAALEQKNPVAAVSHLENVLDFAPLRIPARVHLARAFAMMQRLPEAIAHAEQAQALAPQDPFVQDTAGVIFTDCGQHERALEAFRRAIELAPRHVGVRYNLATAHIAHGNLAEAEEQLEACIGMDPMHWRAHHALSYLRRRSKDDNHVARLEATLQRLQGRVTASLYVGMALAKELEDLGDYAGSFHHLTQAKNGPRQLLRHDPAKDRALFDALRGIPLPTAAAAQGCDSDEPIFILGMPRTGTTLVDRILSSHPQVTSAGELHHFASALKRTAGGQAFNLFSPEDLGRVRDLDWAAIGSSYVESTRPLTGKTRHFTDKLPHNFLYAGLIAAALPRARIICVLRDPMDTCLSNFRQLFAPESPYFDYSYDLLHTGEYYIGFRKLMQHWHEVAPGRIFDVWYEDVVNDQEGSTRALLDFCHLEWDPACLAFDRNQAPVVTASSAQVREPLYRSAMQRWKRYGDALEPLQRLLESAGLHTR